MYPQVIFVNKTKPTGTRVTFIHLATLSSIFSFLILRLLRTFVGALMVQLCRCSFLVAPQKTTILVLCIDAVPPKAAVTLCTRTKQPSIYKCTTTPVGSLTFLVVRPSARKIASQVVLNRRLVVDSRHDSMAEHSACFASGNNLPR